MRASSASRIDIEVIESKSSRRSAIRSSAWLGLIGLPWREGFLELSVRQTEEFDDPLPRVK